MVGRRALVYLDHAATTAMPPEAIAVMTKELAQTGNPSSGRSQLAQHVDRLLGIYPRHQRPPGDDPATRARPPSASY
jgi:hypothetical protein